MADQPHTPDNELLANAIDISSMQNEPEPEPEPIEIEIEGDDGPQRTIQTFGGGSGAAKQETKWKRQPNKTGHGATHVRTFVSKMRLDAIEHLDEQINEWLDEHPELEVKFVTTSHGTLTGKTKEEAMFVSVWV